MYFVEDEAICALDIPRCVNTSAGPACDLLNLVLLQLLCRALVAHLCQLDENNAIDLQIQAHTDCVGSN